MTLSVGLFQINRETGDVESAALIGGGEGLAGIEIARTELWGSAPVVALGATFLPRLADADLWVFHEELDAFISECRMLLSNARTLEHVVPWDEEHIKNYLNNFIRAARRAKDLGGGVFIE